MISRSSPGANMATKPLLSIEETAILLGETRSTLYRAIKAGSLPLPVYTIGRRLRVPRLAVDRLLAGLPPATDDQQHHEACGDGAPEMSSPRRRPMCSAARRSSAAKPSV
jgi:excisionase family DNA binding protein